MKQDPQFQVELKDVAAGLWIWRLEHPAWKPGQGWEPLVASTCVESRGETLLLDPLAPHADATEVWERLEAHPPTAVVILKPDRKSTRLNSSHSQISYAVFCLKKKNNTHTDRLSQRLSHQPHPIANRPPPPRHRV